MSVEKPNRMDDVSYGIDWEGVSEQIQALIDYVGNGEPTWGNQDVPCPEDFVTTTAFNPFD